jgi:hypothetical protein
MSGNALIGRMAGFLLLGSSLALLVVACGADEESVPAEQADATASGDGSTSTDLRNAPDSENSPDMDGLPESDGSAAAIDCSGAGDVCEEPCHASYMVRYHQELDCLAPRAEWLREPDSPGLILVGCHDEDLPNGQVESCFCNEEGQCGWSADLPSLSDHSAWTWCPDGVSSAASDAAASDRFCPPGTFE